MQVSPTLYHDYYVANGFDDVRGIMIVHPRDHPFVTRWNYFDYQHEAMGGFNSMMCTGETQLAVYFTARKTLTSTSDKIPMQSAFSRVHAGGRSVPFQFLITHDENSPKVEQIPEPLGSEGGIRIGDIISFG